MTSTLKTNVRRRSVEPKLTLEQFAHPRFGVKWRCHCDCGWHSKAMPFPNPDAALHGGRLHEAVAHPERIDWEEETRKFKIEHGLT